MRPGGLLGEQAAVVASSPHSCPSPPPLLLEPSVRGGREEGVLQLLQPGHHLPADPDGEEHLHAGGEGHFHHGNQQPDQQVH